MLASEGIKRVELGRDEFTKRVWQWKEKYVFLLQNIYLKNIFIILWHCFILRTSHRTSERYAVFQEKIPVPFLFTISKEVLSLKDKIHSFCIR